MLRIGLCALQHRPKIYIPTLVMDKRPPTWPYGRAVMTNKARRHFQSIAMLSELDRVERHATTEQFAAAAKLTARAVSIARKKTRSFPPG